MSSLQSPVCRPPPSEFALRLLRALRAHGATSPAAALTDAKLAELCHMPQRDVIDAGAELLAAGYLCVASTTRPFGRFLLGPGDDLAPAYDYLRTLESRARSIFDRRKHCQYAIRLAESGHSPDAHGQLKLFSAHPSPDRQGGVSSVVGRSDSVGRADSVGLVSDVGRADSVGRVSNPSRSPGFPTRPPEDE